MEIESRISLFRLYIFHRRQHQSFRIERVFLRFGLVVRFFNYIQQAWLDSSLSLRQFAKLPAEIVHDITKE